VQGNNGVIDLQGRYMVPGLQRVGALLLAALLGAGLAGCGESESHQGKTAAALATVNGQSIPAEAFDGYLKLKRLAVADDKQRQSLLDQYLEREALAGTIAKQGRLDNALTESELNEFRKEMLISRYFEQYLNEQVTDEAVHNYYQAHVTDYEQRKAHVAHILIRTRRDLDQTERQAKKTAIQAAYAELQRGKPFDEVAKSYSEDAVSAAKGGDLGWLQEGAIDASFSATAFQLDEGQYSAPIETPFGFHIVKLIEAPQVVRRPFEAVRGDIRYQLRAQAKQAELQRLLGESKIELAAQ